MLEEVKKVSLESVFKLSLIMNMIDNLSGPMASATSNVGGALSSMNGNFSQACASGAMVGTAMMASGEAITSAVLAPVEATFETRRAIGELSSLGVRDLGAVENAARSFSDQWAGTTKSDFISAAYDIKSGIASLSDEGVAEFTALAGLTAKATKSSIAEMTCLFATGYGIYKNYYSDLSDMEFGEMFSAGIAQSVKQFKTTGSGMAQSIQTLGASATTANVPLEEQLSILGMLQATMGGSEAGTKYKAFLRSAAKGGEALGLSFTDANNQLLSMPEILDILRGKFGETMDAAEKMELQKAFGDTEAVALIDLMYNKVGDLQSNILGMYDALGSGTGVATEMADAMNRTEPERFERLTQRIQNVKESIGNSLLPTINDFLGGVENITTKAGAWIEKNQSLVKIIMLVVLALGGFLTVGGSVIAVVSGVGLIITKTVSAFKLLKAGFGMAKVALSPLIGSVWSFTAALLANPITWIVIGIAALIGGLVLLYNKCEWFRNLVGNIINFFKEKLGAVFGVVKSVFSGIGKVVGNVMSAVKNTVSEKLSNIKSAYESHGGGIKGVAAAAIEGVKGVYTAGFTFLDKLTGGKLSALKDKAAEKFSQFKEAASSMWSKVKGAFGDGLNKVKELTNAGLSAAKATVSEKLNNMKAAYEAHGGGIKGVAAAAMEGVKGAYTAGFTFLNNLTGGKLSGLVDKFKTGVSNIANGVKERFSAVRDAFQGGLNKVKELISNAVGWFLDSGKKVVSTFANGIKSAFSAPVNAVKSGLQKIRNMLPFSDAKEGPLSTLTLSGQRTMTTYAHGLELAQNAPANATEKGLAKVGTALNNEPIKKVRLSGSDDGDDNSQGGGSGSSSNGKKVIIQKLLMKVDVKTIRELQQLLKLFGEVEEYVNGNGGDVDVEDAEFAFE